MRPTEPGVAAGQPGPSRTRREDDMKAKLETIPVKGRGIEIESETEEETQILKNIWNTHGGLAVLTRKEDGNIQLVVAPTVEDDKQ